jgi:hypothetical protein
MSLGSVPKGLRMQLFILALTIAAIAFSVLFTAPPAYQENSVTWKGAPIIGVKDVSETETNDGVTMHRTDAAITHMATFIDGVGCEVKVTTTNLALRGATGYTIGSNGTLVVIGQLRAEGVGAVASSLKTHTYADATLTNIENGLPINGVATMVLTFRCVDPAGLAVCAFT